MSGAQQQRILGRRIAFGILWALIFYVLTNALIGAIVGALAGMGATDAMAGASAGSRAASDFFRENRFIILGVQISVFAIVCFYGLLPGVGKSGKRG